MALHDIIAPIPPPPRNQSLRCYPRKTTISLLSQSPIQPCQFAREQASSLNRSSRENALIDELTLSLSCFGKCHLVTHPCLDWCAQHQCRRAFVAGVDGLADEKNIRGTATVVTGDDAAIDVSGNTGPGPNNADIARHNGCKDNESQEGSSNFFGTGDIRSPPGDTYNGNNEDSGSNYSNGNNGESGNNYGNGNNGGGRGNSGDSQQGGSSNGSDDGHQNGSGNGGSDDDEATGGNNSGDSADGEATPVSDGSEEEVLAERRRYYAIGQPMPRKATYVIPDPLLQRSGEYYAVDFDQVRNRAKRDLPAPSEVQLSCVHRWSVEDGAKGCCHACGGWHGLYVFNCSACRALSRACCTPRWTEVVKARSGLTAKRPDEILRPEEVEHRLAEEIRGFKRAAITEWPLVSKRGRYPDMR